MTTFTQDSTGRTSHRVLIEMYDAEGELRLIPVELSRIEAAGKEEMRLGGGQLAVGRLVLEHPSGERVTPDNEPYAPSPALPREPRYMDLS